MISYITGFIFYTMAMIGILVVGYLVYKRTNVFTQGQSRGLIKIIDTLPISSKKILMIVKIKDEKFLIASGAEHTTFLAKLGQEETINSALAENFPNNNLINQKEETQQNFDYLSNNKFDYELENKYQQPVKQTLDAQQIKNKIIKNVANNMLENQDKIQKLQNQFSSLYQQEQALNPNQKTSSQINNKFKELLKEQQLESDLNENFLNERYALKANNNSMKNNYSKYLNKQSVLKQLLNKQ